jgi:hypothetical protein
MPKVEFDVREHGGLFALVEHFDKAQEFVFLASDLFGGALDFTILQGIPYEGAPPPTLTLEEPPNYSIWVFPKERPKYAQAYYDLGSKLGYLARLMAWPSTKYPLEAIPCGGVVP